MSEESNTIDPCLTSTNTSPVDMTVLNLCIGSSSPILSTDGDTGSLIQQIG